MRTDLKELVDLDLQGRVYGYAPMGDDREDMEGFRFWKTGMALTTISRRLILTLHFNKAIGGIVYEVALTTSGNIHSYPSPLRELI